jgi:hypothetical protein
MTTINMIKLYTLVLSGRIRKKAPVFRNDFPVESIPVSDKTRKGLPTFQKKTYFVGARSLVFEQGHPLAPLIHRQILAVAR